MTAVKWRLAMILAAIPVFSYAAHAETMLTYSSGTGFFVTRDGYVVTNEHVIEHCKSISVSGSVPLSEASLVAHDKGLDLALLKTNALAMDDAKLSSDKQPLRVDDSVVVVGYPGQSWQTGQPQTREARILSTRGAVIDGKHGEEKWVEFSDALALGNSGGPLLDSAGNVVGVVAAKARLITTNAADGSEETVDKFDVAINLLVLREFLDKNNIQYREADSGIYHSADRISDDARRYIVNVRCRLK